MIRVKTTTPLFAEPHQTKRTQQRKKEDNAILRSTIMKTALVLPFLSLICFLYISVRFFVHYGNNYSDSNIITISSSSSSSDTGNIIDVTTDGTIRSSVESSVASSNTKMDGENNVGEMNKSEWPELVGMTGEDAKKAIEESSANTIKVVQVLPEGSIVTMDYSEERVRIFVNGDGIVTTTPRIG